MGNLNAISPEDSELGQDHKHDVIGRITADGLVDVIALRNKQKNISR